MKEIEFELCLSFFNEWFILVFMSKMYYIYNNYKKKREVILIYVMYYYVCDKELFLN